MRDELFEYKEYALNVISGKIVANNLIKLACERYLKLFDNPKYVFIPENVDKVVKFIGKFRHFKDKFAGKKFELLDFQKWIIYSIYGFVYKDDRDRRLVTDVYITMGRKNAKSSLISMVMLWEFFNKKGFQGSISANSYKQAKDIYEITKSYITSIGGQKYIQCYRDHIKFQDRKLFITSNSTKSLDGLNIDCFVIDELHEHIDSKVYDVLISSQASVSNRLSILTTTRGFLLHGFCKEYEDNCIEILQGIRHDDSKLIVIYSLDETDDYKTDKSCWIKANPSLGEIVNYQFLEDQVKQAQENKTLEKGVLTKNFNTWVKYSPDLWLDYDLIESVCKPFDITKYDFSSKDNVEVYCAFDLAYNDDLTSLSFMIKETNEDNEIKYYFSTKYYLPITAIDKSTNSELYKKAQRRGELIVTNTNYTDHSILIEDINYFHENIYPITEILYDNWQSKSVVLQLQELGYGLKPFGQSIGWMSSPTRFLETELKKGTVTIEENNLTKFCLSNASLMYDTNGNCKVIKVQTNKSKNNYRKIDGVISMIMCVGGSMVQSYDFTPFSLN